jgi:hypothetical protein
MIKKTTAWIFLLSSVIINGIYLFLGLTHKVKLTNFAIILISFFGIFTTIVFGEVILKEKRNGNSKRI